MQKLSGKKVICREAYCRFRSFTEETGLLSGKWISSHFSEISGLGLAFSFKWKYSSPSVTQEEMKNE